MVWRVPSSELMQLKEDRPPGPLVLSFNPPFKFSIWKLPDYSMSRLRPRTKEGTHLRMCDGVCGEQVSEGSQMWTVLWACIVRMSSVGSQDVFENVPADELEVFWADPSRPLALQLVVLPRLPLHVVHSLLSTQSVGVDVEEVPPNHLVHQEEKTKVTFLKTCKWKQGRNHLNSQTKTLSPLETC